MRLNAGVRGTAMKIRFATETQRPPWLSSRYYTVPLVLLLATVTFVIRQPRTVSGQSGRGRAPDRTKSADPTPKIREPENLPQQKGKGGKENEDTIRINSDLVNVVVTVAMTGGPSNALADLKQEYF